MFSADEDLLGYLNAAGFSRDFAQSLFPVIFELPRSRWRVETNIDLTAGRQAVNIVALQKMLEGARWIHIRVAGGQDPSRGRR